MRAIVVVVAVFFSALAGADARACSCTDPGSAVVLGGPSAVPINAAVLVTFRTDVVATARAGNVELALAAPEAIGAGSLVIRPLGGTWPASVDITVDFEDSLAPLTFTTSNEIQTPRTSPPDDLAVGLVVAVELRPGGSTCGDSTFNIDIGSTLPLPLVRSTDADDVANPVVTGFGGSVGGNLACTPRDDWSDATFNARKSFRFAGINVDGTLTAFSPGFEVVFPDDRDCDGVSDFNDVCPDDPGAAAGPTGVIDRGGCPDDGDAVLECLGAPPPCCSSSTSTPAPLLGLLLLVLRKRRRR